MIRIHVNGGDTSRPISIGAIFARRSTIQAAFLVVCETDLGCFGTLNETVVHSVLAASWFNPLHRRLDSVDFTIAAYAIERPTELVGLHHSSSVGRRNLYLFDGACADIKIGTRMAFAMKSSIR